MDSLGDPCGDCWASVPHRCDRDRENEKQVSLRALTIAHAPDA